ncbi:hypothetical protein AL451_003795 [Salmonella enterica subsp. enterica serovar Thompson]|nr:hypothetical protein [Salmonella enterica subsp. enterica serovar Thompson]
MVMQQRYFKLNEVDSVKYHKEYQEQIGKPRKKAIRDFLDACNAVGYYSHQSFGVEQIRALLVRGDVDCGRNKRVSGKEFDDDGQALFEVRLLGCYAEAAGVRNGQHYFTWSGAGFYPEKKALVVRIPVGENGEKPLPADMSPALTEIKRSEFIAVTEE